jgi:hypothetical protein
MSLQIITSIYVQAIKWANKQWICLQLQVGKWMKISKLSTKHDMLQHKYMCLQGTHFLHQPNKFEIIVTKFK